MSELLISGKKSFKIEVPYKLVETGLKGEKPLIIYLHGYKQNLEYFQKKVSELLSVNAYHLFLQGPYPIYDEKHKREVKKWGRAWYLYDGQQQQFIKSMERSSVFIQQLLDHIIPQIQVNRSIILGYSMGGYLAGYFALSRPEYINDLIVVGARIKTEHFIGKTYPHLKVLALHGVHDQSVAANREKESCVQLEKMGASVTFRTFAEHHRLSTVYVKEMKEWLQKQT